VPRHLEERISTALGLCVQWASARPAWTLVLASLLVLVSGLYAAGHLGVDADTDDLFERDLPFRQNDLEIRRDLPLRYNNLLVVIDAPTDLVADQVARRMVGWIRSDQKHFEGVFAPGVGDFFDRNGLLYLDVKDLEVLADDLAGVQPLLAEIARDPTVRGVFDLLTLAAREASDGKEGGFDVTAVFREVITAL